MKKYFVLIVLLLAFYLPSQAELSDTIWTHLVPNVTSVKFSPDGKYIYAGSKSNIVSKIDVASNQIIKEYTVPRTLVSMDLSQDGKIVAVACDTTLEVFDTETGEKLHTLFYPLNTGSNRYRITQETKSVSISYDNTFIGVVFNGGAMDNKAQSTIAIWELQTGKLALNSIERNLSYQYFVFSPTENKYAVGFAKPNQNNKVPINLYEVGTWKLLNQFEGHNFSMDGFKFSKDGNLLASWGTSDTNIIKIWDMNNKTLKQNLISDKYLTYGVWDVCFLNDSTLISSSEILLNSQLIREFILIDLNKQTKIIIADGVGYIDLGIFNNRNLFVTANYTRVSLFNLEKTLDINLNENNTNITLYPNPVTKELNISLENITNTLVNYNIINNTGQIVQNNTSVIQNNILKINISNISNGYYILNLNLNNTIKSFNFIIQ